MRGVITSRDVLLHPMTICAAFGAVCYLRCLKAVISGRRCTFLEVVTER